MSLEIDTSKIMNEALKEIKQEEELKDVPCPVEDEEDEYTYCDEEDMLEEVEDDFDYQIKERGKNYYNSGKVLKVIKASHKYYARVEGSSQTPYKVTINNIDYYGIDYECDCPYDFPCKHEYAVLIAISKGEYEETELKPEIAEKRSSLQSLIEIIPANEIKDYLLSSNGLNNVAFQMSEFEDHFRKYLPKQKYEFYYNNLYNELLLGQDVEFTTKDYINRVKQYLDNKEFAEGYKILKSIIEAYNDSNKLNFDDSIVDMLPKIGMFLRVSYRKCDSMTKDNITKWVNKLKESNYYNNYYLEDVIVSLEKEMMNL